MRKKMFVLVVTLLIIFSSFVIIPKNFKVEASSGGDGGGDDGSTGLDYWYMWNVTQNISNVVHKYPNGMIPKGRAWATWGENYAIENLLIQYMENNENCNLEDVHKEKLGPIADIDYIKWYYTSKIETVDFELTINNDSYPYTNPVPTTEMFTFPSGMKNRRGGSMDYIYSFENLPLYYKNITDEGNTLLGGAYTGYYLNVSYNLTNDLEVIIGNVTYIASNETLPEEQEGMVFLMDEELECEEKINNVTNATGVILIYDTQTRYKCDNSSNCSAAVLRVESTDNNLSTVKNMLQNGTIMIADNVLDNETITFTYNLNNGWWPDDDFIIITDRPDREAGFTFNLGGATAYIWCLNHVYELLAKGWCHAFIMYNYYYGENTHFMLYTNRYWCGYNLVPGCERFPKIFPFLPVFSINANEGSWLSGQSENPNTTVSGFLEQKEEREIHKPLLNPEEWTAGVDSYNVIGNITIEESPGDAVVLISNRFDGWWGETPGDSGAGAGIVLAIAKYFNDHNIVPKYNLTFLMTTGEEYGKRGARHYRDNNEDVNFDFFIGFDQLGINQSNAVFTPQFYDETKQKIVDAIVNDTFYTDNTGFSYESILLEEDAYSSTEDDIWKNVCDTISFMKMGRKEDKWHNWHTAGQNYNEGDSLKNQNRTDLNVTLRVAWNVTKYFTVDPNCWLEDVSFHAFDSPSDGDDLDDSINVSFTMKTGIPHDLVMVKSWLNKTGGGNVDYEQIDYTVDSSGRSESFILTVPETGEYGSYKCFIQLFNSTGRINELHGIHVEGLSVKYNDSRPEPPFDPNYMLYPLSKLPEINNVSASPNTVGFGSNVTISADFFDDNGIDTVKVNITYPDSQPDSNTNFTMTNISGSIYEYVFNDTWQNGQYNFSIWAMDNTSDTNVSVGYCFNVSGQASVSVCTEYDEYDNDEDVNITDPPNNPSQIGYKLLDDDSVLHVWNRFDSYYFNTSNGIQITNHYNNYWSHNVLMLGYYNNDEWNLIYRADELSGFNKNIDSDDETYINITLWKDLTYSGYDFRLAIRYYLGVDDNELTVIPYIKNLDDEPISYVLGFAWEINDIRVDMTPENDYIEINRTTIDLDEDLDLVFTNMSIPVYCWDNTTNTSYVCDYEPIPYYYIREDKTDNCSESLYLRWDPDLNYKVWVKSRDGEFNAPVILGIKIGTLGVGQEKYTSLFWHDANEVTYYFNSYSIFEAWATNPGNMVDSSISTYASSSLDGDVELCHGNSYKSNEGKISKVEIRAYGNYSGANQRDIILRPVFSGKFDGDNHDFITGTSSSWSSWFDITSDSNAPESWSWDDIGGLDCDVEAESDIGFFNLYCHKVEVRVTFSGENTPMISDPYPSDSSTGISISPMLNITVSDPDGDNMTITWLSNSSGSWAAFGWNSSVVNGTYHQSLVNASVNGEWWYWKVNVTDGDYYNVSDAFSFYTGYESKISNSGSTNISGYLLIQVQFYQELEWVVADDTVNENNPRTINSGGVLALDTIFNGNVNSGDLIKDFGAGSYRVYACFRDPDGTVLVCDNDSLMEDSYQFTVSES